MQAKNRMHHHKQFNDNSHIYREARPKYPAEIYRYLAKLCPEQFTAWDCACGNGQVASNLADYFKQVQATDVSENQIANAIARPNIEYSVTNSESTPFADSQFDLICVAQAIHWFDYEKFWPEVERVLKAGGIFAFWGYTWPTINSQIDNELKEGVRDIIKPYWAPQNRLLWDRYEKIELPFKRLDTPEFRMAVNWNLDELYAYLFTWSAARRYIEANTDRFLLDSYERMLPLWGDKEQRREVEMEFCFIAGVKGKRG